MGTGFNVSTGSVPSTKKEWEKANPKALGQQYRPDPEPTVPKKKSLLDLSREWAKTEDYKRATDMAKKRLEEAKQNAIKTGTQLTPEQTRNIGSPLQYSSDEWKKKLSPQKKQAKGGYIKKYARGGGVLRKAR